jgi:hypothetical protein
MQSETGNKKEQKKAENINLRSEDVQDILGRPPGWLVSYGIGTIFIVIIIVLTGSGFFSYPDIVRAPVVITKENPPSVLIARAAGKPEAIFMPDGAHVKKYDTIAVIENPARYQDLFRLGNYIRIFNQVIRSGEDLSFVSIPGDLVLGEVQPEYNAFKAALNDYRIFISQDIYENRIAALSAELE